MTSRRLLRSAPSWLVATGLALGVAAGVLGLRAAGALEPLELGAYDRLLRWTRPAGEADPRVVILRITERNIQEYGYPLSDEVLAPALGALADASPRAIGVDLYRDRPLPPGSAELERLLRSHPEIVLTEKVGGPDDAPVAAPAWFLPEATPLSVVVTIVDPNGVEPLLEATLPGPLAAGVHAVRLAEHGVRLAPGVEYQWFVALVVDPTRRARDVVSGGSILDAPAAAEVAAAPPARRAHAYAEAGLWYDAFDQLSVWLEAEPHAAILHVHRAALLEQVGLTEAARYERGQASGAE